MKKFYILKDMDKFESDIGKFYKNYWNREVGGSTRLLKKKLCPPVQHRMNSSEVVHLKNDF